MSTTSTTSPPSSSVEDEASLKALGLDEKQISTLLKLLGTRCVILSIASLKLFSITEPPEHVHWKRRQKCVATVVKECHKDSGVEVVVLNLDKKKIYWEKAMPSAELEYKLIKPLFHLILDVDEGMVGLNFKSTEEAAAFAEVLTKHLAVDDRSSTMSSAASDSDSGKLKVEDHQQQLHHFPHEEHQGTDSTTTITTTTTNSSSNSTTTTSSSSSSSGGKFSLFKHLKVTKGGNKNNSKLAKERISSAYDFAHIHHMAYDSEKAGFTYDYLDAGAKYNIFKTKRDIFSGQNLERLLEAAGVTASELNGEEVITKTANGDSDEDDSKSMESSTDDNLDDDDPPPANSANPPKLKISTVSENLELSKIMTELKLYQRESYYTKDFAIPLTPKIVDFQPGFDEEDEEEEEEEETTKDENQRKEENAFSKPPPQTVGTTSAPPVRKDLFAQIGVDAMKAFQNRSLRMTTTTSTTITTTTEHSSAQTTTKNETVEESNQTTTTATIPMPAPRRSKFFPSSENLLLHEEGEIEEEKTKEEEKEFRENLI